jgi:hypothetical protein
MSGGYVIARENFKEAEKHVSAENDPVMFNLLFGLQSLTTQIEADIAVLLAAVAGFHGPAPKKAQRKNPRAKKMPGKGSRTKKPRRSR